MTSTEQLAKKLGITPIISAESRRREQLWRAIYSGRAPWLYNGAGRDDSMQTLNLGKTIAAKIAKMVMIEAKISLSGGKRAQMLAPFVSPFLETLRKNTEYALALGGIIFKPYIAENEIFIETVLPERFFPTAVNGRGEILGGIFTETLKKDNKIYTKLERHEKKGNDYFIENRAFISTERGGDFEEISLKCVSQWARLAPCVKISGLKKPLFAYFGMPGSNAFEPGAPFGISIFAGATDLMREADRQFSRILWEFEGSELAIDADITALSKDENGRMQMPQRDKRLFRNTRFQGGDSGGDFYQIFSPAIRDTSLFNGLDKILKQIESACGLSFGVLSDPQQTEKTATEIKAAKQEMYITVTEVQKSLSDALHTLLYGINALADLYGIAPAGDAEFLMHFDDSILNDPDAEKAQDMQEVAMGLLAPQEYRMKWFGESEEAAKRALANAAMHKQEEKPLYSEEEE